MKTKFKLLTIILTMCLVLAVMGVGVFAATNVDVSASGSISFAVPNDVFMTISGDARLTGADNASSTYTESKNYTEQEGIKTPNAGFDKWSIGNIEMNSATNSVTYTFNFTNDNTFAITGQYAEPNPIAGTTIISKIGDTDVTGEFTIAAGATTVLTVEVKVTDLTKEITNAPIEFSFAFAELIV